MLKSQQDMLFILSHVIDRMNQEEKCYGYIYNDGFVEDRIKRCIQDIESDGIPFFALHFAQLYHHLQKRQDERIKKESAELAKNNCIPYEWETM